jgi:hypothetical protein
MLIGINAKLCVMGQLLAPYVLRVRDNVAFGNSN